MLHCVNDNRQQGVILIVTLLYLMVIAFLISAAFECSILGIKTSTQNFTVAQAFQNAEQVLRDGEEAVNGQTAQGQGSIGVLGSYQFSRQSIFACGLYYYQVTAVGLYHAAQVKLSSILQIPTQEQKNCPTKVIRKQRIAWEQLF